MKKMLFVVAIFAAAAMTAMPWTGSNLSSGVSFLSPDSGTPDAYGYVYVKSGDPGGPTFNWIDISTSGTLVTGFMDDNVVGPFPIGFDFPYYWYKVNQVYLGSNGYLSFSSNQMYGHPFDGGIPSTIAPPDLVAIFTGDLDFTPGVGSPACYYYTSPTLDTFIVTYDSVQEYGNAGTYHTFQVILTKADSCITMQYGPQNGTYTASGHPERDLVGIQNITKTIGLQFFRDGTAGAGAARPVDGMAVAYIPPESTTLQIHDVGVSYIDNPISGGLFIDVGADFTAVAEVKNFGNQSESSFNTILRIYRASGSAILFADTVEVTTTLNPGESYICTFDPYTLPVTDTTYRVQVRTYLTGDMTPSNDSLTLRLRSLTPPSWLGYTKYTIPDNNSSWTGDSSGYGNQFLPPNYPFVIDSIGFYASAGAQGDVYLVIMDDDGANGEPGTVLFSTTVNVANGFTGMINVPVAPTIQIDNGMFYAGAIIATTSTIAIGYDIIPPGAVSRRSYEFTGSWAPSRTSSTQDYWVFAHGSWTSVGVDEIGITVPSQFSLACPTFVTAKSVFSLSVVSESDVSISLFDVSGRNVRNIFSGTLSAGNHSLGFDSEDISSGLYFLRATVNGTERSLKVNIVR